MQVNVALIQMACGEDRQANVEKTLSLVEGAASQGAQIICLQELYASRYFPQSVRVEAYDEAKEIEDIAVIQMQKMAKQTGCVIIFPIFERAMEGVYFNTALIVDDKGEISGKFRKIHIPDGPQYHEKFYFTPGDKGIPVFKTKFATIGVGICWDEWFPEQARIMAMKGAQILFYPSAIGSEPDLPGYDSQPAWETVIKSHAITNNCFVAAVNRVGQEDAMNFYGTSFICNPNGEMLAQGSRDENEIVMAELNLDQITKYRNLFQFHRDRRPECYGEILNVNLTD